ncbi:MAG: hypothetical protein LBU51_04770 [Bacteroidales bacterium]|jgi:hypothetical protein|nr:hypothetical protein [Bacteroidales bacterium]
MAKIAAVKNAIKEEIRKDIRGALNYKKQNRFSDADIYCENNKPIEDAVRLFITNFRSAGGKFVPCSSSNFVPRLLQLVEDQRYSSILSIDKSLISFLQENKKSVSNILFDNKPADLAIFMSNALIARMGAICLTQKNMLYPSIHYLAKDIIIVADKTAVFEDLKSGLDEINKQNKKGNAPLIQIIIPEKPTLVDGEEHYSPDSSRIILFFLTE